MMSYRPGAQVQEAVHAIRTGGRRKIDRVAPHVNTGEGDRHALDGDISSSEYPIVIQIDVNESGYFREYQIRVGSGVV